MNYKFVIAVVVSVIVWSTFGVATWIIYSDWQVKEDCWLPLNGRQLEFRLRWEVINCNYGHSCHGVNSPSCSVTLQNLQSNSSFDGLPYPNEGLDNLTQYANRLIPSTSIPCCGNAKANQICQIQVIYEVVMMGIMMTRPGLEYLSTRVSLSERNCKGFKMNVLSYILELGNQPSWLCYSTRDYTNPSQRKLFHGEAKLTTEFYIYVTVYSIAMVIQIICLVLYCIRCRNKS